MTRAGTTHDDLHAGEDPLLTELKGRQRNRATQTEIEEQRPVAKPKAAKRQNKRGAHATLGSVEQHAIFFSEDVEV